MRLKAMLSCGSIIEFKQGETGGMLEMIVSPREGAKIEDAAYIKDNSIHIYMWPESLLGIYQLIEIMIPRPKLGLFSKSNLFSKNFFYAFLITLALVAGVLYLLKGYL